jgi:mannose-1-phosphate guanylyltransferase
VGGAKARRRFGMKALLLAAGVGSRLGELTRRTPKCLLPIGGRPLMDYWLEAFEHAGVTEVLVNLHHHPDQVRNFLQHRRSSLKVETFHEPELLGSAGTLSKAWSFVEGEESFLVAYADNFARVDLRKLLRFHREKKNPVMTLVAYRSLEPQRCGIVELDTDGRVMSFEEKPAHPKSNYANSGIHVASSALRAFLPHTTPADLGFHVLPQLVGRMYGYVTDEYIQDIGSPEAYARVQELLTAKVI